MTPLDRNAQIFLLCVEGDLNWLRDLLKRMKRAGYSALYRTVDTAYYRRRERQMMGGWLPPKPPRCWRRISRRR